MTRNPVGNTSSRAKGGATDSGSSPPLQHDATLKMTRNTVGNTSDRVKGGETDSGSSTPLQHEATLGMTQSTVGNTLGRAKGGATDSGSSTPLQHPLTGYVQIEVGALGEYEITEKPTGEEENGSRTKGDSAPRGGPSVGVPQPAMEYPEALPQGGGGGGGATYIKEELKGWWAKGAKDAVSDLFSKPILIAVMGKTGTGKTSFINEVTGGSLAVGHELNACKPYCSTPPIEVKGN